VPVRVPFEIKVLVISIRLGKVDDKEEADGGRREPLGNGCIYATSIMRIS
jgi:hypothetical protein